jgi:hypothetical protein
MAIIISEVESVLFFDPHAGHHERGRPVRQEFHFVAENFIRPKIRAIRQSVPLDEFTRERNHPAFEIVNFPLPAGKAENRTKRQGEE